MRHGLSLFTSDRGITPAAAARQAEQVGFHSFYVPEHTHIPARREALHPTGGQDLPDQRYFRTLDPWVSLATAAQVTSQIRLGTSVSLPVESDPITLAKTMATLDHLSGGRVVWGAGFGWNTDELADHGVPGGRRRTALREYVEAIRALWTQEEAAYKGEFVSFGAAWAYPKPVQSHIPLLVGAGLGPRTAEWIAANADGWITTPLETDVAGHVAQLRQAWYAAGRVGDPRVQVLAAQQEPDQQVFGTWERAGVSEVVWGLPDVSADDAAALITRRARELGLRTR